MDGVVGPAPALAAMNTYELNDLLRDIHCGVRWPQNVSEDLGVVQIRASWEGSPPKVPARSRAKGDIGAERCTILLKELFALSLILGGFRKQICFHFSKNVFVICQNQVEILEFWI